MTWHHKERMRKNLLEVSAELRPDQTERTGSCEDKGKQHFGGGQ